MLACLVACPEPWMEPCLVLRCVGFFSFFDMRHLTYCPVLPTRDAWQMLILIISMKSISLSPFSPTLALPCSLPCSLSPSSPLPFPCYALCFCLCVREKRGGSPRLGVAVGFLPSGSCAGHGTPDFQALCLCVYLRYASIYIYISGDLARRF